MPMHATIIEVKRSSISFARIFLTVGGPEPSQLVEEPPNYGSLDTFGVSYRYVI